MMRSRLLGQSAALLAVLLIGARVHAERAIVVLDFGGSWGAEARETLVLALQQRYTVLPGKALLDACARLHLTMSRGRALAACAREAGAGAVIGGSVANRRLKIAVYSGLTGDAMGAAAVPWAAKVSRNQLRAALEVIVRALDALPDSAFAQPRERTLQSPRAIPTPPVPEVGGGSLGDEEELPLSLKPSQPARPVPPPPVVPTGPPRPFDPRLAAAVGFGVWVRSFAVVDLQPGVSPNAHPRYQPSPAPTLRFALEARPLAFLSDGVASRVLVRLRYQRTLGLVSRVGSDAFSTTIEELLLDAGYQLRLFDRPQSPLVDGGIGFGLLNFKTAWGDDPSKQVFPDSAYRFLMVGLGGRYPLLPWIDVHAHFDYRFVFGSGQIEDRDRWYGPASTGGLALTLGVRANYSDFFAAVDYTYTRFFQSFSEAVAQATRGKLAAGGALDQLHAAVLSLGYSL